MGDVAGEHSRAASLPIEDVSSAKAVSDTPRPLHTPLDSSIPQVSRPYILILRVRSTDPCGILVY